ncbi:MAG: TIGR02147 family protein [Oligoflexales bacterium]
MITDFYGYSDYRNLFKDCIKALPKQGNGKRAELAAFIKCQPTYVSHVFAKRHHFSLEQAEAACRFFKFKEEVTNYIILLVNYRRAGNQNLRKYFKKQVDKVQKNARHITAALGEKYEITPEEKTVYYSSWQYAAIHMLATLPDFNSIEKIETHLLIPAKRIKECVEFLLESGIFKQTEEKIKVQIDHIHLGNDETEVINHYRNLRLKAIEKMHEKNSENLHFSCFLTCSREDKTKIKKSILDFIRDTSESVKDSPPEALLGLNIDFYEV